MCYPPLLCGRSKVRLEFRYNHRYTDIFEKVSDYLCDLVPKLE